MRGKNFVYIATSLDGRIADRNNEIAWLNEVPNPEKESMGIDSFFDRMDAVVMGKNTFEVVLSFGIEWPYKMPVFVLSSSLKNVPEGLEGKVEFISGTPKEITEHINGKGYQNLYIDGGLTIQSFLKEDLIDEMIISTMPIILGGGPTLFGELPTELRFNLKETKVFLNEIIQNHYIRNQKDRDNLNE